MNENKDLRTPAIQFGVDEPVGRCLYYEKYCETQKGANIKQTGLFIDAEYPILGASPDGIVSCHCCGKELLEIKCSAKYKDKSPIEVCSENSYHLYLDENNKVSLKYDSPWYIQIQGQMGVSKMKWCDCFLHNKRYFCLKNIF
jgi:hypothetical protein